MRFIILVVLALAACEGAGLDEVDTGTDAGQDAGPGADAGCPWLCLEHAEWCDMLETGIARPELPCPGEGFCCEWKPAE